MREHVKISTSHPRAESLHLREKLVEGVRSGVVSLPGLIAHGRGEAFDYLLGEKTCDFANRAISAAASLLLLAKHPTISVNGNAAMLVASDIVKLAKQTRAGIEVNLFYRSLKREKAIRRILKKAGALEVLGVGKSASARIPEVHSERRAVDPRGILASDVVLVPLEDGDRTEALRKMGKQVIAIDLNPISRTSVFASVTIVDNIVRAMPRLVKQVKTFKHTPSKVLNRIVDDFHNGSNLGSALALISQRLLQLEKATSPF